MEEEVSVKRRKENDIQLESLLAANKLVSLVLSVCNCHLLCSYQLVQPVPW